MLMGRGVGPEVPARVEADRGHRIDDLFNLVYDPAFLTVAWSRVRGNQGARTAGVDGVVPRSVVFGAEKLLTGRAISGPAGSFLSGCGRR
jgi:RNA-directed DNA polymerase